MNAKRMLTALLVTAVAAATLASSPTAEAAAHHRAAAYKPSLKASTDHVLAGKKVVLSGTVKPAAKGGTVIIEKKIGDRKWVEEKRTTMGGSGKFSYTDKPDTPGVRLYRVVVPKSGNHAKGTSKSVLVTVFRWQSLSKVEVRSNDSTYLQNSVAINGHDYGPAFVGANYANEGFIDWNLDRECTQARARFGNSDLSDDLATATITLVADGETLYTKSFALAQSETKTFDITDVFRFGFHWSSSNPSGTEMDQSGASATFAEPEVLCAF